LGIGDSAGMFPISEATKSYDVEKIQQFDALVQDATIPSLARILPMVQVAGGSGCRLVMFGSGYDVIPLIKHQRTLLASNRFLERNIQPHHVAVDLSGLEKTVNG
jgi:hypothetical protein